MKDYDIKDLILLSELNNFIVNENNMEQESLINNFNYVKENDKNIIKNLPSEIDNNIIEEKKADNSISNHDNNIGKTKRIRIKCLYILIKILKKEILISKKRLILLLNN